MASDRLRDPGMTGLSAESTRKGKAAIRLVKGEAAK
jgi:hypothetical protein